MVSEKVPRIRQAPIPDDAVLVVRGDDPESVMAVDAQRFRRRYAGWRRYGVSAFVARDAGEIDALCETRLVAWATVLIFRRQALEQTGIEIVPTFRTPHVTLAHADLAELLELLMRCEHDVRDNPYHEQEPGPLEAT